MKNLYDIWAGIEFMGTVRADDSDDALGKWCARAGHGTPEQFCEKHAYMPREFYAVRRSPKSGRRAERHVGSAVESTI